MYFTNDELRSIICEMQAAYAKRVKWCASNGKKHSEDEIALRIVSISRKAQSELTDRTEISK